MVWFQIIVRNSPLTMSAAPATARQSGASHRLCAIPKAAMAAPHTMAASTMARPRTAAPVPRGVQRIGHEREQRVGVGEEHRRQVNQVGAQRILAGPGVGQALADRARLGAAASDSGGLARISASREAP